MTPLSVVKVDSISFLMGLSLSVMWLIGTLVACVPERFGPPDELVEHQLGLGLVAGRTSRPVAVRGELLPVARQCDDVANGHGLELGEDLSQLRRGVPSTGFPAVADDRNGLGVPLLVVPIQCDLQRGRKA